MISEPVHITCPILYNSTSQYYTQEKYYILALCKVQYLLTVIFYYDQSDVACGGFVSLSW